MSIREKLKGEVTETIEKSTQIYSWRWKNIMLEYHCKNQRI
jgi:hypothetical protein